jgi:hypothetical protein
MKTKIEVTRGELGILLRGAEEEWRFWSNACHESEIRGWRDDKEKDRVLTYQHQSWELVKKLEAEVREMDTLAAVIVDTQ